MQRTWTGFLCLLLAFAPGAARADEAAAAEAGPLETVLALQVDGELDIDAGGHVAAFRIETPVTPSVRASLERSIPAWRFEPRFEGEAITPVTVNMQISLRAQQVDAAYRVTVENVRLWAKDPASRGAHVTELVTITPDKVAPPRYPLALLDGGVQGKVLVGLLLDADGSVARATVVQSQLYDAKGKEASLRKALGMLERSTLDGARHWKFTVAAQGGVPTPADLTVLVPVQYVFDAHRPAGALWRTVVRTAHRAPDWMPAADERARLGVADVGDGGAVPSWPSVRLATDPAGSAL